MANIEKLLQKMSEQPSGIRFVELVYVCKHFFGVPRQSGTSHLVFKMPWAGDPRVNIQDASGRAKPYQVRQVLAAIERLKGEHNER